MIEQRRRNSLNLNVRLNQWLPGTHQGLAGTQVTIRTHQILLRKRRIQDSLPVLSVNATITTNAIVPNQRSCRCFSISQDNKIHHWHVTSWVLEHIRVYANRKNWWNMRNLRDISRIHQSINSIIHPTKDGWEFVSDAGVDTNAALYWWICTRPTRCSVGERHSSPRQGQQYPAI